MMGDSALPIFSHARTAHKGLHSCRKDGQTSLDGIYSGAKDGQTSLDGIYSGAYSYRAHIIFGADGPCFMSDFTALND